MSLRYKFKSSTAAPKTESITYHDTETNVRYVCFVRGDGTKLFLNYAHLTSGAFMPEENSIRLAFATHAVELRGRNLAPLFESFALHRPRQVETVDERYAATEDETESIVTRIEMSGI